MLFGVSEASRIRAKPSVLVFGGGRGIGEAVARGFAAAGAEVMVAGRTSFQVENVADEIGGRSMTADIGDAESVAAVFSECGPFQVVVNSAAVQGGSGAVAELWKTDPPAFADVVRIDLLGSYHVLRESIRSMESNALDGSVILFSGGGSTTPRPRFGAYGASKSAVLRMVESTALELRQRGSGIRIFTVAPGAVHTQMTEEVLRLDTPAGEEEVDLAMATSSGRGVSASLASRLCCFLAGPDSAGLAGRLVHIHEDYEAYASRTLSEAAGCLRRVGYEPGIPGEEFLRDGDSEA